LTASGAGLGYVLSIAGQRISRWLALVCLLVLAVWWGTKVPWGTLGHFAPIEQTGPLIQYIDAHRRQDDVVVVYYSSVYPFAYYSSEPWTLVPNFFNTIGFAPRFDNPHIVLLAGHRGDNSQYDDEVLRIGAVAGSGRIWVLMSHIYGDEASYLTDAFSRMGTVEQELQQPNAILLLIGTPRNTGHVAVVSLDRVSRYWYPPP
jgi:hypothetical protein